MSRLSHRPRADHRRTVEEARRQPGVWLHVVDYRSTPVAEDVARRIRNGYPIGAHAYGTPYQPTGAFEARTELVDDGTRLQVRYIGGDQ
ncbi:hypothetical protein [Streptomyces flaveolus]|uniref:hypothetical protein n=1 Tax=Streptomyces flaveolus TaxID=67297 RepID=UPI00166FFADD|nr:hypothetical protein [Streptomyces flaveolus]GGQ83403.1 hypothetical protein GCM10010216_51510 [Streptomyces flaveolus]